ncbi:hypothetical protein MKW98_007139 [Papaver atlanticum]|uniref:Uncharacterized protein n=1 Tax=Papaver atlanticum TaxID=357466 RepID=A0AAD4SMB4_9MAGN|nr:hypothetical protein MKW98_007139 [Papaver atlanticum]
MRKHLKNHLVCPGCGVHMQGLDPKLPGYFMKPSEKKPDYIMKLDRQPIIDETVISDSIKRGNLDEPENEKLGLPKVTTKFGSKPVVSAGCHSPAEIDENSIDWKQGKSGNVPRVVLVVKEIDLRCLSPTRLEHWVRTRAREGGAGKVISAHLVSAVRGWGLKHGVCKLAGARGNVWAVGAQNAGKWTLINSIGKHASEGEVNELTEAPVPGTTLGSWEGVFVCFSRTFETKNLQNQGWLYCSYCWANETGCRGNITQYSLRYGLGLPLHIGKTENVETMLEHHFGRQLQPPINEFAVSYSHLSTRKESSNLETQNSEEHEESWKRVLQVGDANMKPQLRMERDLITKFWLWGVVLALALTQQAQVFPCFPSPATPLLYLRELLFIDRFEDPDSGFIKYICRM